MGEVIKAPHSFRGVQDPTIFLAGSIEMGTAVDWQASMIEAFAEDDLAILSPRRDDFDTSQPQTIENDYFREQVGWEIAALESADVIFMYFAPGTKSPIALLELGLFARSDPEKLIVCCPTGFWRKGNVDIVCDCYGVEQVDSIEDAAQEIRESLL